MPLIPVSIVTGSLGSGKTTLLNYLLTENHGIRIGVIVNEFGDVGIDSELIVSNTDEMIELTNGCVCCTVRGDLVASVKQILATGIEYILIETSGLAEPAPVANTFLASELRAQTKLDGIITVVDAENFTDALAQGETARDQVAAADVILLNKVDLVSGDELREVEDEVWGISPRVFIFRTVRCRAPLNILLATGRFNIDRWLAGHVDDEHEHASGFAAVAIRQSKHLRIDEVNRFVRSLPVGIFRAKGILSIGNLADPSPEKDMRMVFHKVGKRIELFFDRPWRQGEAHETKIVLIGESVEKERWQAQLDLCVME
jgi:G3E family GTPase